LFYAVPIGIWVSSFLLYTHRTFTFLCHTYLNAVVVIPTLTSLGVP